MTEPNWKVWRLYNYKCDVLGDAILALSEVYAEAFEAGRLKAAEEFKIIEVVAYQCGHDSGRREVVADVMPSDEEIKEQALKVSVPNEIGCFYERVSFLEGAKWMRARALREKLNE